VALEAIRQAGTKDRRAITDAALAIRDFDGALGHWGFDANGDTTLQTLTVSVVRDGRFDFEEIIDAGAVGPDADPAADARTGAASPEAAR
jgi:branched-chain amino acid transport system substrate-binding protein